MNEELRSLIVFQLETKEPNTRINSKTSLTAPLYSLLLSEFHYCAPVSLKNAQNIERAEILESFKHDAFDLR